MGGLGLHDERFGYTHFKGLFIPASLLTPLKKAAFTK
jgi:hypothetical protein